MLQNQSNKKRGVVFSVHAMNTYPLDFRFFVVCAGKSIEKLVDLVQPFFNDLLIGHTLFFEICLLNQDACILNALIAVGNITSSD